MSSKKTTKPVDLGELQNTLIITKRAAVAAEGVLKRAQEARDRSRAAAQAADQALRDATRAVLG